MHRTIDDYDSMAKREIIKAKQEKAQMYVSIRGTAGTTFLYSTLLNSLCSRRVQKFRTDYSELRTQFDRLKVEAIAQVRRVVLLYPRPSFTGFQKEADQRAELISSSGIPSSPSDARRRFQNTPSTSQLHPGLRPDSQVSESPFRGVTPQPGFGSREQHALDEHTFIQNTENRLDEFLAQGREVLDNLVDQRNMLKGTQRRLLDAANTLGLSRDVIGWIERRRLVSFDCVGSSLTAISKVRRICTSSLPVPCLPSSASILYGDIWGDIDLDVRVLLFF